MGLFCSGSLAWGLRSHLASNALGAHFWRSLWSGLLRGLSKALRAHLHIAVTALLAAKSWAPSTVAASAIVKHHHAEWQARNQVRSSSSSVPA